MAYDSDEEAQEETPKKTFLGNQTDTFVGTPYFVSPEMINNKIAGPFTDIWALGVILCHMITGRYPWKISLDVWD